MFTSRRQFLATTLSWLAVIQLRTNASEWTGFRRRGIVLTPEDLSWTLWPAKAAEAGLNTIALHHSSSPKVVTDFVQSAAGQRFLDECRRHGLEVEYELHAMRELLPRALFDSKKELFRLDERGKRTADANLCVHSEAALSLAAEKAVSLARVLNPASRRFFFWGDDGMPWCRCAKCQDYTDSEQALILENYVIQALRVKWPQAQLAHLAYSNTLEPPRKIKPSPGVFLEFAPINRRYDLPYADQDDGKDGLNLLRANLEVFPRETAQVLEYWMDVSRFSRWKKPAVKLPWNRAAFRSDLQTYRKLGISNVTSFGVYIEAEYIRRFGEPPELLEYGGGLSGKE